MKALFFRCRLKPKGLFATSLFIALTALLASCTSPESIANFASDATKAIDQSEAIFADIHGSCIRRHAAAAPVTAVFFPAAIQATNAGTSPEAPQCAVFGRQSEALTKAASTLSSYFRAMQQLAAFNSTATVTHLEQAAGNIGTVSHLSSTQVDSVAKLAGLVTQLLTEQSRQRDLARILTEADPSIASITQGFEQIVSEDYESLLREEQRSLAAQYQTVGDVKAPATILLLNRAYADDLNELHRRQSAAEAFAKALSEIRAAHHALAANPKTLKARELGAVIQPYTDKLEALLPVFTKRL